MGAGHCTVPPHAGGAFVQQPGVYALSIRLIASAALAAALIGGCSTSSFGGYADNRCTGQQNQCQRDCLGLGDGPARSACIQRCYAVEDRCHASGYDGSGSSLSVDQGVDAARSEAEKEAEYEAWRKQRQREKSESGENDVEIEVIEPK